LSRLWPEALARAAVERWERSKNFTPGEVTQAVRVELSEKGFPAAWRTGGFHEREAILGAASALEAEGLGRVRKSGRGAFAVPVALTLSPEAVEQAYAALGGATLRSHVRSLLAELERLPDSDVPWVASLYQRLREEVARGTLSGLGHRAKEPAAKADILDALRLLPRLARRESYLERTLSGEVFSDTKRLQALRPRLRHFLLTADPVWTGRTDAVAERELFGYYGESFKPTMTAVAAGLDVPGLADLSRFRPCLSLARPALMQLGRTIAQVDRHAEGAPVSSRNGTGGPWLTTIENPTSFHQYLEEPGVWERIGAGREVVLYTEGFASDDLLDFIKVAAPGARGVRHWGDTDAPGIRIALLIMRAAGKGSLYRSDADWVRRVDPALGQTVDAEHRQKLEVLLADPALECCTGARELTQATLEVGRWFEQEQYREEIAGAVP
jgi:hypothetical protein